MQSNDFGANRKFCKKKTNYNRERLQTRQWLRSIVLIRDILFIIRIHWRIQGGAPGTRAPPGGPNSFIFMQFSAKMWKIIAILGVGAPPGENPGSATGIR